MTIVNTTWVNISIPFYCLLYTVAKSNNPPAVIEKNLTPILELWTIGLLLIGVINLYKRSLFNTTCFIFWLGTKYFKIWQYNLINLSISPCHLAYTKHDKVFSDWHGNITWQGCAVKSMPLFVNAIRSLHYQWLTFKANKFLL